MTTVCILMASGLGRRFGGDKLMAEFCGEPMICRALAATDGVFDRRVVLTRSAAAAKLCLPRGALGELAAPQSGGGRQVMARHPGAVRTVPATSAAELEDVDTQQDLARLERLATD